MFNGTVNPRLRLSHQNTLFQQMTSLSAFIFAFRVAKL
ncbi:hypothetical protein GPSY_2341 [Paraglaciecola psychrophila 170]|nr:hypothetical protein GPSY_2341 [Paraglaciecola psychrophila 170]